MTPDRAALRATAEAAEVITDRNGQPCYLRVTGTGDAHEWATGKGIDNEPVQVCIHCGSYRYSNEGRRRAFYDAADPSTVLSLLDALDAAEAEVSRLCTGPDAGRWRMSIPARDDHDSDFIIDNALTAMRHALDAAEARLARLSPDDAEVVEAVGDAIFTASLPWGHTRADLARAAIAAIARHIGGES